MKILHISTNDNIGGAARATYRIHQALLANGIESSMRVINKSTSDKSISNWYSKTFFKTIEYERYRRWLIKIKKKWQHQNKEMHSFGKYSIHIVDEINNSDADIVHLHWISEMLSIKDIGRIKKPIVWTMHDMWPFCGAEHYAPDDENARFIKGYFNENRPSSESGLDLNRITWLAKSKYWDTKHFYIVSTSNWLHSCAKNSKLFRSSKHFLIPYPLESIILWKPILKKVARTALGLPQDSYLILMGAEGGTINLRKGADLMLESIKHLEKISDLNTELIVFGQSNPEKQDQWNNKVHWLGSVNDDRILALAYSAADVMIVPSRQEAFGQTGTESLACGTPVVAFDIGGLSDIVIHKENGWLAKPFDIQDMADGIKWILEDPKRHEKISENARNSVLKRYNPENIALQYKQVYEEVLNSNLKIDSIYK